MIGKNVSIIVTTSVFLSNKDAKTDLAISSVGFIRGTVPAFRTLVIGRVFDFAKVEMMMNRIGIRISDLERSLVHDIDSVLDNAPGLRF